MRLQRLAPREAWALALPCLALLADNGEPATPRHGKDAGAAVGTEKETERPAEHQIPTGHSAQNSTGNRKIKAQVDEGAGKSLLSRGRSVVPRTKTTAG